MSCIFCKIIAGIIPASVILKTDSLIVIQDIQPKAPIHFLIIPYTHYQNFSDLIDKKDHTLMTEVMQAVEYITRTVPNTADYRLVINNGIKAGQTVFHLHLHFMSGYTFNNNEI